MHEFHMTKSLLQTALDKAELEDGEQIERLYIALDPDSTYLADTIRFYFEQLAQNTAAAGAQLEFDIAAPGERIRLTSIDIGGYRKGSTAHTPTDVGDSSTGGTR